MTWRSHRILTGVTVLLITRNVWFTVAAVCGSTFPDRIEMICFGNWQKCHRKLSHWFVLYLLFLGLIYFVSGLGFSQSQVLLFLKWFFVGCLSHILEDAVSGRVPFLLPGKKKQVLPCLCYTGSVKEDFVVGLYVVLVLVFLYFS